MMNPAYKRADGHIFPDAHRWSPDEARRAIEMPGSRVVVAEVDGVVAGCIQLVLADRAEFGPLATGIDHQGRGIATRLIAHAERLGADAGFGVMRIFIIEEVGLRPFYESLGYGAVRAIPSQDIPDVADWGAARPFTLLQMEKPL
jgi:GNAT superfamily N-acetyltransferase